MSCDDCCTFTVENLPAPVPLTLYIGTTFNENFEWKTGSPAIPVDLTSYTAAMKVKVGSDTVISLTDTAGIVLGGVAGTIAITISATATALLTADNGNYDLILTSPGGEVTALVAGPFYIRAGITIGG